jgi:thiosulfate reductase cytochrome b subunit
MTILPNGTDLGVARGWHFFALYIFAFNLAAYMIWGFARGRFRRVLRPVREDFRPANLMGVVWKHIRMRPPAGEEVLRYNPLQKFSYIAVLFVLLPLMIFTGMAMSPASLARFPFLLTLFDGRQSARTIHFICANLLILFTFVHITMVLISGVVNQIASMISGWYHHSEDRS